MTDHKSDISPFAALIVGLIAGATAVLLSHEPTRKSLKKNINTMLQEGEEKVASKVEDLKEEGKKRISNGLKEAQKVVKSA